MDILRKFLESSTIHGLSYISTEKVSFSYFSSLLHLYIQTRSAKILWLIVVCLGFIGAGILIGKSYKDWQENPIATSITTHPIDDLDFPVVTICPPKSSNTALYHDLAKAGNGSLSEKDKTTLRDSAYKIFMETPHKAYVKKMSAISHMGNLDQVYQGFHSLPKPYKHNGFEIKMWYPNGTITSPWYGGEYVEEFYKEDRDFHVVLELPNEIKERIGSGSLLIELEIDTREEKGWIEQIGNTAIPYNYTLHKTEKTWTEAEAECQKEGGHLASVTSEEVNKELRRLGASTSYFWVGGRKESGLLSWSDKSAWGYTNYESGGNAEHDHCIKMDTDYGTWSGRTCASTFDFICQVEYMPLRGKDKLNLIYRRDHLTFFSFHVWYKYKAASQQLLDSWKEKRMTGFKLSWRIENETRPLIASIGEVGRSIKTPHLGETSADNAFDANLVYMTILTIPENFQEQIGTGNLVVDLDVDMISSDEVYAFTSYKLYKLDRDFVSSEALCKRKGGQLASIHSEWEQTLAERAADGNWVWLGGSRDSNESQWQWSDGSTWGFTKWQPATLLLDGRPDGYDHLQMNPAGQWFDYESLDEIYFLCQGETVTLTESGLGSVQFKKEQLKFFPFHVLFKSRAIDHRILNSSTDEEEERRMTGFTLNWFLEDDNGTQLMEKLPARQEDWVHSTPRYKQPLLTQMVQLARHLRVKHDMTKEQILDKVIRGKMLNIRILKESRMCSMEDQISSDFLDEAFPKLVSFVNEKDLEESATDEDVMIGFEIFHAIVYCPSMDIKLFLFVDQLLSNESSRTIIQTAVNLFRSGVLKDLTGFTEAKQFYQVLVSTLDLQYGNVLLATSTKSQLQAVINNDWPFFTNQTDLVKTCLLDSDCDSLQDIFQKLGRL